MASALAKDLATVSPLQTLEKELAAAKTKLAEVLAARVECHARRKNAAQEDDKQSYLKEKKIEDELDFEVESTEAKIDKLEADRPAIVAREEAERLRLDQLSLGEEIKRFQKDALKKIEAALGLLCEELPREEKLFRKVGAFNLRAVRAGLAEFESPEAPRHLPGVPAHQDGTRNVQRSRLRPDFERSSATGPSRYETYTAIEPVVILEVPAFKPEPLFRCVIVPSFHRDGPRYSPPR